MILTCLLIIRPTKVYKNDVEKGCVIIKFNLYFITCITFLIKFISFFGWSEKPNAINLFYILIHVGLKIVTWLWIKSPLVAERYLIVVHAFWPTCFIIISPKLLPKYQFMIMLLHLDIVIVKPWNQITVILYRK